MHHWLSRGGRGSQAMLEQPLCLIYGDDQAPVGHPELDRAKSNLRSALRPQATGWLWKRPRLGAAGVAGANREKARPHGRRACLRLGATGKGRAALQAAGVGLGPGKRGRLGGLGAGGCKSGRGGRCANDRQGCA